MLSESEVVERVKSAYAGERFEPTFEEIVARAGRRPKLFRAGWMPPLGAAATAAAVIAAFVAAAGVLPDPDASKQAAAWDRAFAEACARVWTDQARGNPALTPQHQENPLPANQVFAFRDGELGLRLYVFEPVMFACSRDEGGQVTGRISGNSRGEPFLPRRDDLPITYAVVLDPSGGAEYLFGRVPADADRMIVRTAAGDEFPAPIDGTLFAAWSPRGGLAAVEVTAYRGTVPVASGPAVYLRGTVDAQLLAEVCDQHVREQVRALPPRPVGEPDLPPLRFVLTEGAWSIRLYASSRIATSCSLAPDGTPASGGIGYGYDQATGAWSTFAPYHSIAQFGEHSWVLGLAPAATQRVELVLTDGRVLPAKLADGYFAITWVGTSDGDASAFRFHTPSGVVERPYG